MRPFWRSALRSAIFLVLSVIAFVGTNTFLWMPLLLLAIFFLAVDTRGIDKRKLAESKTTDVIYGVLGDYVVDETPSFGLFIRLNGRPVFVDIKQDRLAEVRKARAAYLFEHQDELDEQLVLFVKGNPRFATCSILYIGLHSENIEQGEVFWDPEGYTLLNGLSFAV